MEQKMRLVTRSDFDGLACAMMLKDLDTIPGWRWLSTITSRKWTA